MKLLLTIFVILALFQCCLSQVGWEVETRIEVSRVDPSTKTIKNFDVRTEIPMSTVTAINKIGDKDAVTKVSDELANLFKNSGVWQWTLDGVEGCVSQSKVSTVQREMFHAILDNDLFKKWEKDNKLTPLTKKGDGETYSEDDIARVNRFAVQANQAMVDKWKEDVRIHKMKMADPEFAKSNPPAPKEPIGSAKFKYTFNPSGVNVESHKNIIAKYQSYAAPTETRDGKSFINHDYGCRGILELKTSGASDKPLPFSEASIQSARDDLAKLTADGAPLSDKFVGSYEFDVSGTDRWILTFFGSPKFSKAKDMQFTYNADFDTLDAVSDLSISSWPAAPITKFGGKDLSIADQNRQRLLLKLKSQVCSMDKNNMHPYVKSSNLHEISKLSSIEPFKTTRETLLAAAKGKPDFAAAVNEAFDSAKNLDAFATACRKAETTCTSEEDQATARGRCVFAYFAPADKDDPLILLEQRMTCTSAICQAIADPKSDVKAIYTKYKDMLK